MENSIEKFNKLDEKAFKIFLNLIKSDTTGEDVSILSTNALEIANAWQDNEQNRKITFYGDKENRNDWIKGEYDSALNNVNQGDLVNLHPEHYGNKYWVIPEALEETPILATFSDIDDNFYIFYQGDKKVGKGFRIVAIQPTQQ